MRYGSGHAGFSLLEAMVVIAIFSIVIVIGVPSLRALVVRKHVDAAAEDFFSALRYARYLAVTRQERFGICPRSTGSFCAGRLNTWSRGWLVFEARDRDGTCAQQPGVDCVPGHGQIFRVHPSVLPSVRIHANHNVSLRVFFNAEGMSPGYNGRFSFCDRATAAQRSIVLSVTGRPRWARGHCSAP